MLPHQSTNRLLDLQTRCQRNRQKFQTALSSLTEEEKQAALWWYIDAVSASRAEILEAYHDDFPKT